MVLPAVHCNWPILSKLFFSFVHLADEIDEPLSRFWNSLFWPVSELELTDRSWLAVLSVVKRSVWLSFIQTEMWLQSKGCGPVCRWLTLASVTLNSRRMYWGMLYSAMGSTTKYWYLAERSAGQYWWHFSCSTKKHCSENKYFYALFDVFDFTYK